MSSDPEIEHDSSKPSPSLFAEFQEKVSDISWGIFSVAFLVSLLSIGYEIFVWLKDGQWPDLKLYAACTWLNFDPFTFVNSIEWQGVKKIIRWCLELPLSLGLLGLGAMFGGGFHAIFSRKD